MNQHRIFIKTALLAVFMVLGLSTQAQQPIIRPVANQRQKPSPVATQLPQGIAVDFAYPRDAYIAGEKELEASLREKRYADALLAAIVMTISADDISKSNGGRQIQLLDSLIEVVPQPYSALAMLIEAQLYSEIYSDQAGKYRNRVKSGAKQPATGSNSYEEWSYEDFREKIIELTDKALNGIHGCREMPLTSFMPLIQVSSEKNSIIDIDNGFTIYDFMVYKTISLRKGMESTTQEIPFFKNDTQSKDKNRPEALLDNLIEFHNVPNDALAYAIIEKSALLGKNSATYLWGKIQELKDYPAVIPILWKFNKVYTDNDKDSIPLENYYEMLENISIRHKDSNGIVAIDNILAQMRVPKVNVHWPQPVMTSTSFTLNYDYKNLEDFYILVFKSKQQGRGPLATKISELEKYFELYDAEHIVIENPSICLRRDSLTLKIDKPGYYAVVASKSSKPSDAITNENKAVDYIHVTDIHTFTGSDNANGDKGVYVVNAGDSRPISEAEVEFEYDYPKKSVKKKTNKEGYAEFELYAWASTKATYKGNDFTGNISGVYYDKRREERGIQVNLFKDLGLYKPGQTVEFCGVVFRHTATEAEIVKGYTTELLFANPSSEIVERVKLTSDDDGRFEGTFTIPEGERNGIWRIYRDEKWNYLSSFEVADYKAPTFFIRLEQKDNNDSGTAEFEGIVSTYSGMPLADTEVKYEITYRSWRPWLYVPSNSYASTTVTDEEGKFRIELPLENVNETDYRYGRFSLQATATSPAGETAVSNSVFFGLSKSQTIVVDIPGKVNADSGNVEFRVSVKDILGYPVSSTVNYELFKDGEEKPVTSGEFQTPTLTIPTASLTAGRYRIRFISPDDSYPTEERSFILYRSDDKTPPVTTPLWVPETEYKVGLDKKEVEVNYGSSYRGQYVLCVISTSSGKESRRWLQMSGKNETLKVAAPKENERTYVQFFTVRDHEAYQYEVTLIPERQLENVKIETVTFRDRITPGAEENWEFQISLEGKPLEASAMAVMTDKALDAIYNYNWPGSLFRPYYANYFSIEATSQGRTYDYFIIHPKLGEYYYPYTLTWFNTYGRNLYGNPQVMYKFTSNAKKSSAPATKGKSREADDNSAMTEESVVADMEAPMSSAMTAGVMEGAAEEPEDNPADPENLRDIEHPVAFFKSNLHTDTDGKLTVDFKVPDFNTEWKLQLFAYTPEMNSASATYYAVASKRVMVRMNAPRFMRTGDDIELTATLFNNSGEEIEIGGKFEIFNVESGEILASKEFEAEKITDTKSRVIVLPYHCPDSLSAVGVRVYAISGRSSDGEQTIVPILPSSQPVIESTPFYLHPGETEYSLKLPEFKETDRITLSYTDNPIWTVLTTLPGLITDNPETLISALNDFYANCAGYGLIKNNPELREGLNEIIYGEDRDSLMVSNLYKNNDLKVVALKSTPWVNNAFNETLRLSKLGSLLKESSASKAIYNSWRVIKDLQSPEGGWRWFKEGEPSVWMTTRVLLQLGMLQKNGMLETGLDKNTLEEVRKSVERGFLFLEREIQSEISKYKNPREYPYINLKDYVFARSFYPEISKTSIYSNIESKVLAELKTRWRDESLYGKATTAMLLWRNGYQSEALSILESLRQFASYQPDKGMWFDNLKSSWNGASKLQTTTRVLEAFQEIEPEDEAVDRLRQWLLIQRQAQSWEFGNNIDLVNAILTGGTRWTGVYELPDITVGDIKVPMDKAGKLTGSITTNLSAADASGAVLTIRRRSPGPAWGGVVAQYIAPMTSVKEASIPDLRIEKEYRRITSDETGKSAESVTSFHLGDKVRVSMIIHCDRDLQYVVINDERAACLEPASQLSGYTSSDRLWFYREVKNSTTNLFFYFMPKGTHIITYDCYVSEAGEFSAGVATIQSEYAPLITAHSKGEILTVEKRP